MLLDAEVQPEQNTELGILVESKQEESGRDGLACRHMVNVNSCCL